MAHAALGEKEAAIQAGRRAVELEPINKDAINGPLLVGYLAVIYAWTGEKDLAFEQLERATRCPAIGATAIFVLHPYWDPLRGDPRFEQSLLRWRRGADAGYLAAGLRSDFSCTSC